MLSKKNQEGNRKERRKMCRRKPIVKSKERGLGNNKDKGKPERGKRRKTSGCIVGRRRVERITQDRTE